MRLGVVTRIYTGDKMELSTAEIPKNFCQVQKLEAHRLMDRSKIVAIITGTVSILLAIAYLLLVQILDFRGEMIPAPVSFLGFPM